MQNIKGALRFLMDFQVEKCNVPFVYETLYICMYCDYSRQSLNEN